METLGRYRLGQELGRGGGGVVRTAVDDETGETVAIKLVPLAASYGADRATLIRRLKREAQSAAALEHPNIIRVREFEEDQLAAYFVMEFVQGITLEQILDTREPLDHVQILSVIEQVAEALDFAHARGVVHRDIKPGNILVTADGCIKVADFGVAKLMNSAQSTQLTTAGTMLGSPHYMSPEAITETGVDGQSDQFSLAVMAYELLTGRKPFQGDFAPAVMYLIVGEAPPAAHEFNSALPPGVNDVLQRALAKKKPDRYPNCTEFAVALHTVLAPAKVRDELVMEGAPAILSWAFWRRLFASRWS